MPIETEAINLLRCVSYNRKHCVCLFGDDYVGRLQCLYPKTMITLGIWNISILVDESHLFSSLLCLEEICGAVVAVNEQRS